MFIFLAALDLIGLSLLAPYMRTLMQQSIPNMFDTIIQIVFHSDLTYSETIVVMSMAILLLYVSKSVFSLYILKTIFSTAENVQANLKLLLTQHALTINFADFSMRNAASFQYNINMVSSAFSQKVILVSLRLLSDGLILAAVIIFFAFYDWQLFMFMSGIILISFCIVKLFLSKKISKQGELTNYYNKKIVQSVNESLDGMKEIKASGHEALVYDNISLFAKKYASIAAHYQWLVSLPRYTLEFLFIAVFVTGVLFIGAEDFTDRIPSIAVLVFAIIRLIPILSNVLNSIMQITFGLEAFKLIVDDIDKVTGNVEWGRYAILNRNDINNITGNDDFKSLELRDVGFRYSGADIDLFSNVNFTIQRGEFIAITGASGIGKTSLIDIVAGLIKPSSGVVYVNNNKDLLGSKWWKDKISYLPQDPFLLDESIKYNIVMGEANDEIDFQRLHQVIKMVDLERFVSSLENGLDTSVGDRGKRISGGQKQRIALARALYSNREVILLDEATSALDSPTEQRVLANISNLKGRRTVISITHSQDALDMFDSKLILCSGGINRE
jgi:ABC-type bacteriocin/lantibiotic exporter with double-glycine peptidase domain